MKRMLMIAGAVCSLLFLTGTVSAVEYKWDGSQFVEVGGIAPSNGKQIVTIPPGYHAHTRTDGTTFVHGDENFGDPAAHAGVARPWPKTGFPGQTVEVNGNTAVLAADPCPNGICPVNRRVSSTVVTDSVRTVHTESASSGRKGPLRQIIENIRERREQRQSNRQARGGVFGFSGGCPCR